MTNTASTATNTDEAVARYMALGLSREDACKRVLRIALEAALAGVR